MTRGPGSLVLVVGPSGAGKDTLIRLARDELGDNPRYLFVRRIVTRVAHPDAEDHAELTASEFVRRVAAGDFALSWRAHGHGYALPRELDVAVAAGRVAIANVSRMVVAEAAAKYANVLVAYIDAPEGVLAERLRSRRREAADGVSGRLQRRVAMPPGVSVEVIVNDGDPAKAAACLVGLIRGVAPVSAESWRP